MMLARFVAPGHAPKSDMLPPAASGARPASGFDISLRSEASYTECRAGSLNLPGYGLTTLTLESRSIESRRSWIVASMSLLCLGMSFGAPWITAVGLKPIAAEMGDVRSVPALASSLVWLGAAAGGILMGHIAERFGIRWTVMGGAVMIGIGLLISTGGQPWQLYVGHGLFMGLLGNAGLNAPLYVYVSRWFDRRRGSALALLSSGGYIAGFVWPTIFERSIAYFGWRWTMIGYAFLEIAVILPTAAIFLRRPPEVAMPAITTGDTGGRPSVLGWHPNVVFGLIAGASFLCCVTMSMPQGHLVSFCTDLGISATVGAAMLSILLGAGFISRQAWGLLSDRIGGLVTALLSSALQGVAMTGFLFTQDQVGLFTVSLAFGIGFSALIPAYVLAIRELFPMSEAHWRVPTLLLMSGTGMATGNWLAGYLYDMHGYYAPAFATGVAFNIANFSLLAMLVARQRMIARA
jgi:MFS family permease